MNGTLITVWLCGAIAVAVFVAMIVSTVAHGRSLRDAAPISVSSQATEILWSMIPIVIVLAAAIPALRTIGYAAGGEAVRSEAHSAAPRSPASAFTHLPNAQALNKK